MIIGVDLDDVLADFWPTMLEFYNQTRGTHWQKEDFLDFDLWKTWGGTRDEAVAAMYQFYQSERFRNILPISQAQEVTRELREKHTLAVVTGRPDDLAAKTMAWLSNYFPDTFLSVHFTNAYALSAQTKQSKGDVCRDVGVDVFLEDALEPVLACAANGIRVLLFDQPWNRKEMPPGVAEHITRVFSWHDVSRLLPR